MPEKEFCSGGESSTCSFSRSYEEFATGDPTLRKPSVAGGENRINDQLQAERNAREAIDRQLATTRSELQEAQRQLQIARQTAPIPPITTASAKIFTDKTIRELRAMYEGRTALQAEAFIGPEKGKWIDTEGTIVRVDSGMAFLQSTQNANDSIECRFDVQWDAKLGTFRHGEILKVRGKIAPHQNGAQIYLQECELRD
jgi:hypothetical protein